MEAYTRALVLTNKSIGSHDQQKRGKYIESVSSSPGIEPFMMFKICSNFKQIVFKIAMDPQRFFVFRSPILTSYATLSEKPPQKTILSIINP